MTVRGHNMPTLTISECDKCPKKHVERYYTSDSFETCFEVKCSLNNKRIAIIDWNESADFVPEWCPLDKE